MTASGTPAIARILADAGLGLEYGRLELVRTPPDWPIEGARLGSELTDVLRHSGVHVEHVGSTAVEGLLAKPILDFALGSAPEDDAWIRVAHAHVVPHEGEQWVNYLRLRNLLQHSSEARSAYETTKLELVASVGDDRMAYTDGKTTVVRQLLASAS